MPEAMPPPTKPKDQGEGQQDQADEKRFAEVAEHAVKPEGGDKPGAFVQKDVAVPADDDPQPDDGLTRIASAKPAPRHLALHHHLPHRFLIRSDRPTDGQDDSELDEHQHARDLQSSGQVAEDLAKGVEENAQTHDWLRMRMWAQWNPVFGARQAVRRPCPWRGFVLSASKPRDGAFPMLKPKKVVLAYSGGLDTSIILKWLQTEYGCEVVTFTADLGQGEELEPARQKAVLMGIKPENIHIVDVREEFVRDFVFPMFRANALYEGLYLLGTSIARPLISQHLVRIAHETGADAVAHGATGKGNDQVRFELSAAALDPAIKVIAPWRLWDLTSRTKLLEFAEANQIPIAKDKRGEAPFSVDANLLHTSSEGKVLENPAEEAPEFVYQRVVPVEKAPDTGRSMSRSGSSAAMRCRSTARRCRPRRSWRG
jgi:hypothetical protein